MVLLPMVGIMNSLKLDKIERQNLISGSLSVISLQDNSDPVQLTDRLSRPVKLRARDY